MLIRRSPHGERGLKFLRPPQMVNLLCRSPHGERGLKSKPLATGLYVISRSPHGERGLKCLSMPVPALSPLSLPTRGAWIEMSPATGDGVDVVVAPHTGSVD